VTGQLDNLSSESMPTTRSRRGMKTMSEFMQNTDAFLWAMESDPVLRSTIVTISLLDSMPDWGELVERFDGLSRRLPIFRQRVVSSPRPAPPRWEDCPEFDLGFHMRRVTASQPGTLDAVLEMGRLAAMSDFDRARPLWVITLIDGLAGGGTALMTKMHHSLSDGIGGVQIAMTLFDVSGRRRGPLPAVPPPRMPSPLDRLRDTLRYTTPGCSPMRQRLRLRALPAWSEAPYGGRRRQPPLRRRSHRRSTAPCGRSPSPARRS
jgi:diacylglycerol O-acyltransferase